MSSKILTALSLTASLASYKSSSSILKISLAAASCSSCEHFSWINCVRGMNWSSKATLISLLYLAKILSDITSPSTKNFFSILLAKFSKPWVKSSLSLWLKLLMYVLIVSLEANRPFPSSGWLIYVVSFLASSLSSSILWANLIWISSMFLDLAFFFLSSSSRCSRPAMISSAW